MAIARALMQQPAVIFADEPVASLDPALSRDVLTLLHEIAREDGIPVLVSLHVMSLALAHSDRIVGLRSGTVLVDAATPELDADALEPVYAQDHESEGDHVRDPH